MQFESILCNKQPFSMGLNLLCNWTMFYAKSILLFTITSGANDLLNDALQLDNGLSAWLLVHRGTNNGCRLTDSFIEWLTSMVCIWVSTDWCSWDFYMSSLNFEVTCWTICLLSQSQNMQFCKEQTRVKTLFSPACASNTYSSTRMSKQNN